jgi:branched-subunit amino acid aminotransferase/4-amino-4-deoxychorismate lyase
MTEPIVFLNDGFVPASQGKVSIYDQGIVLGATLTEMSRTFKQRIFRLDDHLARLYRSLKYAGIHPTITLDEMRQRTLELVEANCKLLKPGEELGIVHFVTPGENKVYAGSAAGGARLTPTVCIHSFPLPFAFWKPLYTEGAHVVTPAIRHVPPQCLDPKTKNRSRLHWWLAEQQVHAVDPHALPLLLDLDGNITECSGSNFIIVVGRTIYSPTSRNILIGISLVTAHELADELGYQWVEKDLQPYDVINADEAMLTTTPYCIAPCTRINGIPIGDGRAGPVFRDLLAAWGKRVGVDLMKQCLEAPEVK